MFAVNLGEVVVHLEGGANFIRRQEGVAAQGLQPLDSEGREPAIFLELWNALDAKICWNAIPARTLEIKGFRGNTRGVKVAQTGACFVHHGRRKRMCVAQSALLGEGSLSAFLKATAIRYASKKTGNELRVIDHADSEKDLIFVVRINVDLGVKGPAVFLDYRRRRIVPRNTCGCWRGVKI